VSDFQLDHSGTAYVLIRACAVVDARTAGALRVVFASVLREGRRFVAVDLTGSAVYGPLGFAPLAGALRSCRDRGGDLYLVGASDTVRGVLGYETRGVRCFASRGDLDRALSGAACSREAGSRG
jgi:anti-anti-sigma regulatory factor